MKANDTKPYAHKLLMSEGDDHGLGGRKCVCVCVCLSACCVLGEQWHAPKCYLVPIHVWIFAFRATPHHYAGQIMRQPRFTSLPASSVKRVLCTRHNDGRFAMGGVYKKRKHPSNGCVVEIEILLRSQVESSNRCACRHQCPYLY